MDAGLRDRPLVYVDDLDHPMLSAEDRRHLSTVRRLGAETAITIADGRGAIRVGNLGADHLDDLGPVEHPDVTTPAVTIAFAPVKGDRPEWTVQKLTELGVARIIVLATDRSVVRWDAARWAKQSRKLGSTIRSAGMQSRRVVLPRLDGPWSLDEAMDAVPALVLAEIGAPPLATRATPIRALAIGPEGGWSAAELDGRGTVGLGETVLRAETACLAAATLLTIG